MVRKFEDIPVESDTVIRREKETKVADKDAMWNFWSWEGIFAESLIFYSDDVADLNDEALEAFVKEHTDAIPETSVTIRRRDKYTFVNYNFRLNDDPYHIVGAERAGSYQ